MQVQCILCDKIESIEDSSLQAKRLLNRKVQSYLCKSCNDRITEKTKKRYDTGKFHLYSSKNKHEVKDFQ
ncbi:YlaI family protein [Pseudogracilibacillus sp. SE30717A]|uniref:YlaI family protein n=1 Tax=Pseudogracilibacillus sp. SE30717A TaxID=3098293 RepID=UPI00300E1494